MKELLSISVIRALCASGLALGFIATAFDVLFVLFCYSPVSSGGLGFDPGQIGAGLAASGLVQILIQVLAMPPLLKRVHAGKMYMICMWVWPLTFLLLPLLNVIARHGGESLGNGRNGGYEVEKNPAMEALLIAGLAVTLALSRIGSLGYSLSLMLVKQYAPNSQVLASTNGLVQFAMCIARSIAPAFVSSVFALSIQKNLLGGNLWAIIMVLACIGGVFVSRRIPRSKAAEADVSAGIDSQLNDDGAEGSRLATTVEEDGEETSASGYEGDHDGESVRPGVRRTQGLVS